MGVMGDMSAMAKEGAKGAIGTIGTMGVLSTKRQTIGVKNKAPWAPSMGAQWLVDEVWGIFSPEADYNKGIQRSIGVLDMDKYFREENRFDAGEESTKKKLLESAVEEIKRTTTNTGDPSGANTTNMSSTHVMHIRNGARTAGQNATANAPPVISTPTRGPKTSSTQPLCTHAANAEF
ncbi:hypothetical protein BC332_14709 [Capsicum chinense]|nr:hypothetical protein BC332_14709 [Capsicum chinense]